MIGSLRLLIFCIVLASAEAAFAEPQARYLTEEPARRLALVVGNSAYVNAAELPGSVIDAQQMATLLKTADFEVTKAEDIVSREDFVENYLRPFVSKVREGDIVIFYFSGHGFTFGGENYITPLDFSLKVDSNDLTGTFVSTAAVERTLSARRPSLVLIMLDACRTIPNFEVFTGKQPDAWLAKGLSGPTRKIANTIYWFSADVGADSLGSAEKKASVYTEALVANLAVTGRELTDAYKEVRIAVMFATTRRQVPWRTESSSAAFYFMPTPAILTNQKELWLAVLEQGAKYHVDRFLEMHGTSAYGAAARRWMAENPNAPDFRGSAVSPIAAEVAWTSSPAAGPVVLPRIGGALVAQSVVRPLPERSVATAPPIGGPSQLEAPADAIQNAASAVRNLNEAIAIAEARSPGSIVAKAGAQSLDRLGSAVVVGRLEARLAPTTATPVTQTLAPGAAVAIDGLAVGPSGADWLRARAAGDDTALYMELPRETLKPIEIGRPAFEVSLVPKPDGLRSVVDAAPLVEALKSLEAAGSTVTWVSIATPKPQANESAAAPSLRGVFVTSVLAARGVSRDVVTTIEGASSDESVRVRVFGRAK